MKKRFLLPLLLLSLAAVIPAVGCAARTVGPPETVAPGEPRPAIIAGELAGLDTVRAGRFDNGKMWTFEYPPLDHFRETYSFYPDSAWFARARLGALRLPNCSASFVSPNGLIMTNHHCARGSVSRVSKSGERLLDEGFYARSLREERAVEGLTADQMIAVEDVTQELHRAIEGKETDRERAAAREQITEQLRERIAEKYGGKDAGILVQITSLWNGARYSAYVFKRHTDLRLVMAPELQVSYFGGDSDNFTYPRYALDMSFYRAYDQDGEPLETQRFFPWSAKGVQEGDAVFVIGNPGSTSRLQTVAQLEYRRDVQEKAILDFLTHFVGVLQAYDQENPEDAERVDLRNTIFSLANSQKLFRGRWAGLQDPVTMARRRDAEQQFREAIAGDPALTELLDRVGKIQDQKRELAPDFRAFIALRSSSLTPAVLQRALLGYRYLTAREGGAPEAALAPLKERFLSVPSQPRSLQKRLIAAHFQNFQRYLGDDREIVRQVLQGRAPASAADAVLAQTVLADSAAAAEVIEAGSLTTDDPALRVVSAFWKRFTAFQTEFQQLRRQENELASSLGRARLDVYGTTIPPDATFSLRIADGVVKGYEYNGTYAPIYTTFYGLYDHYFSYGRDSEWDLPPRWLSPPATFDLSKPLNFVLTADVIGGNSGSPVVDRDLEVVGLIFDGNIESLPGDYIYDPERNRAVAVDVRGMLEALDEMYDADRIVMELTTGRLVATEEEANAAIEGG